MQLIHQSADGSVKELIRIRSSTSVLSFQFSSRLVRLMVLLSALFLEIWDGGTQDRARGFRPFDLIRQLLHTGTYE
jgi:hypothetical protein